MPDTTNTLPLPEPLLLPFRVVPATVHTHILSRAFNHFLKGQSVANRLADLDGKTVCIHIDDLDLALNFRIAGKRIEANPRRSWDVRIRGKLRDFMRLASREEDPDTLFFKRELCLEGDTETGLYIKNILDAVEFDLRSHLDAHLFPPLADVAYGIARRIPFRRLPNPFA